MDDYNKDNNNISLNDIAASYQEAIVDILCVKLKRAIDKYNIDTLRYCQGSCRKYSS